MTYTEFYGLMQDSDMISAEWRNLLKLLENELGSTPDADEILKLIILYFALADDGNVYLSLDKKDITEKFTDKINRREALLKEDEKGENKDSEAILSQIGAAVEHIDDLKAVSFIGENKLFIVDDKNRLFTRKYYNAVNEIRASVDRLFKTNDAGENNFNYRDAINDFSLSPQQEDVISKGIYNNLAVTGGPGTGKTTSVFFLLLGLLKKNPDLEIYLTAPSGKASSRMKDSILSLLPKISDGYKGSSEVEKIKAAKESTVHRLLSYDCSSGGFIYNKKNKFPEKSVFVIDEASMLDVCVFASLLEAIPDGARVFILGDKNQLPSVECGAVFADLLKELDDRNKVELTESKRFGENTDIFRLAQAVNNGTELPINGKAFMPTENFRIEENADNGECRIFYYSDANLTRDVISGIADKWYTQFYANLKQCCIGLKESDTEKFGEIIAQTEKARILCACNRGNRGADTINRLILKNNYRDTENSNGCHPGEIVMITRNNKSLQLFNGDCGVAVKFENDETLYLMFRNGNRMQLDSGKHDNRIFSLGEYIFYPTRMVDTDDLSPAFAITVHKSQGSDYKNILVLLPGTQEHPLLNRQVVYTAITRTKGNTYIISNKENLEHASTNVLTRDTGIEE